MAKQLKLSRLIQPRNPLFWLLIITNGLSSAISFVMHAYPLPFGSMLVLAGFAIGNVVVGIIIALRLMASESAPDSGPAGDAKQRDANQAPGRP